MLPSDPPPALPSWAEVSPRRRAHVERVAATIESWAVALRLPPAERVRWIRAAWLHDALRDASEASQRALAPEAEGPPVLWHGPAAAAAAAARGERDAGVLAAVRWHSLGHPDWDACGDALYCADFLEPGRSFDVEARAALRERFPADPAGVLREVVRARLLHAVRSGWHVHPQTAAFWNRIVGPAAAVAGAEG